MVHCKSSSIHNSWNTSRAHITNLFASPRQRRAGGSKGGASPLVGANLAHLLGKTDKALFRTQGRVVCRLPIAKAKCKKVAARQQGAATGNTEFALVQIK